jgi:hypothetical protein
MWCTGRSDMYVSSFLISWFDLLNIYLNTVFDLNLTLLNTLNNFTSVCISMMRNQYHLNQGNNHSKMQVQLGIFTQLKHLQIMRKSLDVIPTIHGMFC